MRPWGMWPQAHSRCLAKLQGRHARHVLSVGWRVDGSLSVQTNPARASFQWLLCS